jgi:hypothetical protein
MFRSCFLFLPAFVCVVLLAEVRCVVRPEFALLGDSFVIAQIGTYSYVSLYVQDADACENFHRSSSEKYVRYILYTN